MDLVYNPSIISKRMVYSIYWLGTTGIHGGAGSGGGKGLKSHFKHTQEKAAQTTGRWLPGAGGGGLSKLDKGDWKVQVSNYKVSYGGVMHSTGNYSY